jgi:hypothetical protein
MNDRPISTADAARREPPTLGEYNGFEVYPMPFFVTLAVDEPAALAEWYERVLGFSVMFAGPVIHLRRWKYQDILLVPASVPGGATSGGPGLHFGADGDVDALAERAAKAPRLGLSAVEGPVLTPWNTHELRVTDPAGHRLVFTSRPSAPNAEAHAQWKAHFDAGKKK